MMRRLLLPVGLVVAMLAALAAPRPGIWLAGPRTTFTIIAILFLINGYQTDLRSFSMSRRLAGAFVICVLISFLGGSLLAKGLVSVFDFGPEIATGIIVMSTMAPTLSSVVVITRESGGNTIWAILMTVGLNLLAIVAIPVLLELTLSGTAISLPAMRLLNDLVLSVLAPFVVGAVSRRFIARAPGATINLLPTLLVILLSYMSFCAGRRTLVESGLPSLAAMVAALLGLHLAMFAAALALCAICRYQTPERKAVTFLSSQKTLPTAVGILALLGYASGPAALPCVMFHFSQILCDSVIAAFWRPAKSSAPVPEEVGA